MMVVICKSPDFLKYLKQNPLDLFGCLNLSCFKNKKLIFMKKLENRYEEIGGTY
jgi:hypothetical protein